MWTSLNVNVTLLPLDDRFEVSDVVAEAVVLAAQGVVVLEDQDEENVENAANGGFDAHEPLAEGDVEDGCRREDGGKEGEGCFGFHCHSVFYPLPATWLRGVGCYRIVRAGGWRHRRMRPL